MGAARQQHRAKSGNGRPPRDEGIVRLFGVHAVEAALMNPDRKIDRLLMTENAENRLSEVLSDRQVAPERVLPRAFDRILASLRCQTKDCAPTKLAVYRSTLDGR